VWSSPADGPWLAVRAVTARRAGGTVDWLVGAATTAAAPVSLLPGPGDPVDVRYGGDPPALRQERTELVDGRTARIAITDPDWVGLGALKALTPDACVPVLAAAADVTSDARARADGITFNTTGFPGNPLAARAVWNPERRCTWWPVEPGRTELGLSAAERRDRDGSRKNPPPAYFAFARGWRWLYPGDRATFSRATTAGLQGSAAALAVKLVRPGAPGDVRLALRVGGVAAGAWTLPGALGSVVDTELPLDRRVAADAGPLELDVSSAGLAFVTRLAVVEGLDEVSP
jgi:hypothetical protein